MKSLLFTLAIFTIPLFSVAQKTIPPEADKLFSQMMSQINPKHVAWVKSTAKTFNEKKSTDTEAKTVAAQYAATLGNLGGGDIEALAFLVLMQAAKSAQEDLKSIMAHVKDINKQKEDLRHAHETMQRNGVNTAPVQLDSFKLLLATTKLKKTTNTTTVIRPLKLDTAHTIKATSVSSNKITKPELDAMVDQAKKDMDSMSEMGEMESLRLQMAMDRMSKMMSTLSNLLKKISDTSSSIVQNLK